MWHFLLVFGIFIDLIESGVGGTIDFNAKVSDIEFEPKSYSYGLMNINEQKMSNLGRDYNYQFIGGEMLKVTCQSSYSWIIPTLKYIDITCMGYDEENCQIIVSNIIYMRIEDDGHEKYFSCELFNDRLNITNIIKCKLQIKHLENKSFQDHLAFEVNGLVLRPTANSNSHNLNFVYEYFDLELVTVNTLFERKNSGEISVECSFIGKKPESNAESIKLNRIHSNQKMVCQVSNGNISAKMTLTFVWNVYPYSVIYGVSLSHTLLKYKENLHTSMIKYEYTSEKGVQLRYFSTESQLFDYSRHEVNLLSSTTVEDEVDYRIITLKLRPDVDRAIISCISNYNFTSTIFVMTLELIRKQPQNTSKNIVGPYSTLGTTQKTITVTDTNKYVTKSNRTTPIPKRKRLTTTEKAPQELITYVTEKNEPVTENEEKGWDTNAIVTMSLMLSCIIGVGVVFLIITIRDTNKKMNQDLSQNGISNQNVTAQNGGAILNGAVLHRRPNAVSITSTESEHFYETIPENIYHEVNPYASSPAHPSIPSAPTANILEREPLPLPIEAREENRPYIHYDTPYEFRIFRIGVPVLRVPDRFRRRGHPQQTDSSRFA